MLSILLNGAFVLAAAGTTAARSRAFLYIDPCQERHHVLPACEERGVACVLLHSTAAAATILSDSNMDAGAAMEADDNGESLRERVGANTVPSAGSELLWARDRLPADVEIVGVLCGSDGGLADAERLQHVLIPHRSNGLLPARRDKYLMCEAVRAAGLSAPAQCSPGTWTELRRFLREEHKRYPIVLKPRRGQASVLVGLAHDEAQAQHMDAILRAPTCHASIDTSETAAGDLNVVAQEYLDGDEFVVDTVSSAGEHKALAIWRYDKGEMNGAPFVYFCDELLPCEGPREESLVQYAFDALDALGWRWGPCHIELKWVKARDGQGTPTGTGHAVLVEINAGRWNGVDFKLLTSIAYGADSYEATLDAYLDEIAWKELPNRPPPDLRGHARLVKLVSPASGTVITPAAEVHAKRLSEMDSLVCFEPEATEPGEHVSTTVDLATCAGYAHLLHADREVVDRDYRALRELQENGLHELV